MASLEHAIEKLRGDVAFAKRRLAELETEGPARVSTREAYIDHWTHVRDDCTYALNVLYTERAYRDLKRRGII